MVTKLKRRVLIELLISNGFELKRHGGNHDVYVRGSKIETVGRHSDIPEKTANAIISRNNLKGKIK